MSLFQMEYMTYEGNECVLFYVPFSSFVRLLSLEIYFGFVNLANENIHILANKNKFIIVKGTIPCEFNFIIL